MLLLSGTKIRYILSLPADASWNMAVDETLLWSVRQGRADVIVRFYRWEPFALSFGLFQRPEQIIDLKNLLPSFGASMACACHGWHVSEGCIPPKSHGGRMVLGCVRRMTGGKMVYHADEWTFSLMGAPGLLGRFSTPGSSLLEVFKKLMTPFLDGLAKCGLKTHFARQISSPTHDRIHCYSAAAGHSIFLGGKKLIGAAAVRKDGCLAIHGSIPITIGKFPSHLLLGDPGSQKLPDMASLSGNVSAEEIARLPETVAKAYSAAFSADLQKDFLTDGEQRIATFLAREKFSDLFWTSRKDVVWDEKIREIDLNR